MPRPKIGDVIEIDGNNNLLYFAQYTHQHPTFGGLLRVHAFVSRPGDLILIHDVLNSPVKLCVFYPLRRSIRDGVFRIIGNATVTEESARFPIFRDGHANPKTGKVEEWWLWDGEREWFAGVLDTPNKYPLRQIVNDTLLRELVQDCVPN